MYPESIYHLYLQVSNRHMIVLDQYTSSRYLHNDF